MKRILLLKKSTAALLLSIVLVILVAAFIIWSIDLNIYKFLDSDSAGEILLGKEVLIEHSLFPGGWYYSTELRVLYINLLIAPFLYLVKNLIISKIIANIILLLLLIMSYYFFLASLKIKKIYIYLTMALMLTPFSIQYSDKIFIGSYYAPYIICMFFSFTLFNYINRNSIHKRKTFIVLILSIAFSVILGLTGIRFVLILYLPLLAMEAIKIISDKNIKTINDLNYKLLQKHKSSFVALSLFIGCMFGYLVNLLILGKVLHIAGDVGGTSFISVDKMGERFVQALFLIPDLFGGFNSGKVMSVSGISSLINLLLLLMALTMSINLMIKKSSKEERSNIIAFFLISAFINIVTLTITQAAFSERYLINSFIFIIPIIAIYLDEHYSAYSAFKRHLDRRS